MATVKGDGICCPNCGSFRWKVVETIPWHSSVIRRRKCQSCNYQIRTKEVFLKEARSGKLPRKKQKLKQLIMEKSRC